MSEHTPAKPTKETVRINLEIPQTTSWALTGLAHRIGVPRNELLATMISAYVRAWRAKHPEEGDI